MNKKLCFLTLLAILFPFSSVAYGQEKKPATFEEMIQIFEQKAAEQDLSTLRPIAVPSEKFDFKTKKNNFRILEVSSKLLEGNKLEVTVDYYITNNKYADITGVIKGLPAQNLSSSKPELNSDSNEIKFTSEHCHILPVYRNAADDFGGGSFTSIIDLDSEAFKKLKGKQLKSHLIAVYFIDEHHAHFNQDIIMQNQLIEVPVNGSIVVDPEKDIYSRNPNSYPIKYQAMPMAEVIKPLPPSPSSESNTTSDRVYEDDVDTPPQFPGGEVALMKWINDNLRYPELAMKNGTMGRVIVSFIVEKDGSISDVKVARRVDEELDTEAVRLVKCMPKWLPGKVGGNAVRVAFNLPVSFKLNF